MSISQHVHTPISRDKSSTVKNRRDILLAIADLTGERQAVQFKLEWLDKQIAEKRDELKNFDQVGV